MTGRRMRVPVRLMLTAGVCPVVCLAVFASTVPAVGQLYPDLWGSRTYGSGAVCSLLSYPARTDEAEHWVTLEIEWPDKSKLETGQSVLTKSWTAPSNPLGDASTAEQLCSLGIRDLLDQKMPSAPVGGFTSDAITWVTLTDRHYSRNPSVDDYSVDWGNRYDCSATVDLDDPPNVIDVFLTLGSRRYATTIPTKATLNTPEPERRDGMHRACLDAWADMHRRVKELQ